VIQDYLSEEVFSRKGAKEDAKAQRKPVTPPLRLCILLCAFA